MILSAFQRCVKTTLVIDNTGVYDCLYFLVKKEEIYKKKLFISILLKLYGVKRWYNICNGRRNENTAVSQQEVGSKAHYKLKSKYYCEITNDEKEKQTFNGIR